MNQTFMFSWEIKNFCLCIKRIIYPINDRLVNDLLDDVTCFALLVPNARNDPNNDHISFYWGGFENNPILMELFGTAQVITEGIKHEPIDLMHITAINGWFGVDRLASRSDLEKHCVDGSLKIRCIVKKIINPLIFRNLLAVTSSDVKKICKVFKLAKFSRVRQGKVLEESITLPQGSIPLFGVCLSIVERSSGEVVVIEFRQCDSPGIPLCMNVLITVLDNQGRKSDVWKHGHHIFHAQTQEKIWRFPSFINKTALVQEKKKYLTKDALALRCEIAVSPGIMSSEIVTSYYSVKNITNDNDLPSVSLMKTDMKDLYTSKCFADIQLRVFGETVAAHKIILRYRSKRFEEMLDDGKGIVNDLLDLTDVDMVTLKRMLKYMYTDDLDDLKYDDAVAIYTASRIYRIESLKCKYSFDLEFDER